MGPVRDFLDDVGYVICVFSFGGGGDWKMEKLHTKCL